MPSVVNGTTLTLTLLLGTILFLRNRRRRVHLPYPPGPKKLPVIGNLYDIPSSFEWKTYAQWGKDFDSDILHLSVAGSHFIILNSFKAAKDLFDTRPALYSSRPQFTMMSELMGWDWLMPGMVYGERWKERRRAFQHYFHVGNTPIYRPTQLEFIRKMLPQLLRDPDDFLEIARHAIGAMAMSLTYGLDIQERNDPYLHLVEAAVRSIGEVTVPGGTFLVDVIPQLKYAPEWFPGAGFKKKAKVWRKLQEDTREVPFAAAMKNMDSGVGKVSFTSVSLSNLDQSGNIEHQKTVIQDTAGQVFGAATDTTLSAIHSFFAAMLCFPESQRKAQEELDRVLQGRLPDFGDEPDLPYLSALIKEVLRWEPSTPIAIPHCTTGDDVYRGYRIPKGSMVIGNAWAMLHDEVDYPDPLSFKPERFLKDGKVDPSVRDPAQMAFGFGRRICAGSHIAISALWITAASVLATFDISPTLDKEGLPIEPSVEYLSSLVCFPKPFKCTIKPRSIAKEELIRSAADSM